MNFPSLKWQNLLLKVACTSFVLPSPSSMQAKWVKLAQFNSSLDNTSLMFYCLSLGFIFNGSSRRSPSTSHGVENLCTLFHLRVSIIPVQCSFIDFHYFLHLPSSFQTLILVQRLENCLANSYKTMTLLNAQTFVTWFHITVQLLQLSTLLLQLNWHIFE